MVEEAHPAVDTPRDLARGFTVGVVAGLRSTLPLALIARRISNEGPDIADGGWIVDLLAHRRVAWVLAGGSFAELIVDKTPWARSRVLPLLLMGRVIAGGTAAGVQNLAEGRRSDRGALVGSIGALLGSVGGYWWRTRVQAPTLLLALAEDAIAVSLGAWATRR